MNLSLSRSTLPVEGLKGVFTDRRIRRGELAIISHPDSITGHDLLGGVLSGSVHGRGTSLLNRWDPIFDVDVSASAEGATDTSERRLAKLAQSMPMKRPLVLFSRERFLALRHTWASDRHYTMFLPHVPSVDIVLPTKAVALGAQVDASPIITGIKLSKGGKNIGSMETEGSAALDLSVSENGPSVATSEIFFEVNDPFPFQLPDPEDVANPSYWKQTKQWLTDYSHTVAINHSPLRGRGVGGRAFLLTPNVQLVKIPQRDEHSNYGDHGLDDGEGDMMPSLGRSEQYRKGDRYALVATRDIPADSELFLSYGADWWRQRLLSTLLLSAETPAELGSVRWIERLCAVEGQEDETFPFVVLDKVAVRGRRGSTTRTVLWDALRQERAPSQAVIAYAVRQSCVDGYFAGKLMELFAGEGRTAVTIMPALRRMIRSHIKSRQ